MPDTVSFEHYEVLTRDDGSLFELGRGAMGVTYKAFDTNLRMPVALKVINAQYLNSDVARQRFVREARSAAKLRHRNVATVYHLGTESDAWFYAMEFIDGETVDALIKRHGPLEPVMALQVAAQVCRALNAAVPHGLVHRDIKPANLMLVHEDDELVVKVIDFGLAKSSLTGDAEEDAVTMTMSGFVGTPHFASPEQLDEKEIDVRSDIYSLGVTLWYMLAGKTPFAGSMAQVMSQHLSKPPPFEQIARLPAPASALLRKMLEKDPAKRHQTPQELRRAIEECIEQLSGLSAAQVIDDDENFATILDDAQQRPGETQFEPRAVIAGRYRIAEALGETNSGRVFRCYDRERQRDVRMLVLNPELVSDRSAYTQIQREVEKIEPVHHENLLEILDFEATDGASFLILEWTDGFSLLELLRARRELEADEALALLKQAAAGADFALKAGLKRLDFALHLIVIHFAQSIDKEKLMREPLAKWPPFTLKLNPLGITRELSASETWAGAQTMVHGVGSQPESGDITARYVQALGAVVYEVLGGTLSPLLLTGSVMGLSSARYTPLSTLSEKGNEVLKRALDTGASFPSAEEFFTALKSIEVLEVKRPETKAGSAMASHPSKASSHASRVPRKTSAAASQTSRKKKFPVMFLGTIGTVALIATGLYYLTPRPGSEPITEEPAPDSQTFSDSPDVTPPPDEAPPLLAQELPAPAATEMQRKPEVTTPQREPEVATPPPNPRHALLRAALAKAEATELEDDPTASLQAWLNVSRDFPESEVPRRSLDFVIDSLRKRPEIRKPAAFAALKPLLIKAARLDVTSAMMLLGQIMRERKEDATEAFNWYSAAAAKDVGEAYTQIGLMLSNGFGTKADLGKAFVCFQVAAEKGEIDAKAALAECYLLGKGTKKDIPRGLALLKEAADEGSLRAMNRLGRYAHHGELGVPMDYKEALRLFTKVSETSDIDSTTRQPIGEAWGNLGVLYMKGHGAKQDAGRAVKCFENGSKLGDAGSMRLLAICYADGKGKEQDPDKAQEWFIKAAKAGDSQAREWCREEGISLSLP
jgi:serine/threonine protein kinase